MEADISECFVLDLLVAPPHSGFSSVAIRHKPADGNQLRVTGAELSPWVQALRSSAHSMLVSSSSAYGLEIYSGM
jgi:hypothetical protein